MLALMPLLTALICPIASSGTAHSNAGASSGRTCTQMADCLLIVHELKLGSICFCLTAPGDCHMVVPGRYMSMYV